jgi:LPS-assembly protein
MMFAGARYDLNAEKISSTYVGVGYIDDCLILALNYQSGYSYSRSSGNEYVATVNNQVMLQLSLRTLGNAVTTEKLNNNNSDEKNSSLF